MTALIIAILTISGGVVVLAFLWALCRAAGKADERAGRK